MFDNLKKLIEENFCFSPNKNQLTEIERLIFEITRRQNTNLEEILKYLKNDPEIKKYSGRNVFFGIKNSLIKRRFPLTSSKEKIDTKKIFLNRLPKVLEDDFKTKKDFVPEILFVEKSIKSSYLIENFKKIYPEVKIEELNFYNEYIQKNKFSIKELKRPLVFLIKEKNDFLKPCPCTKKVVGCGYWILNVAFGCPYDCSYCFLQCYSNFPGIIIAENLEDFFLEIDNLYKKIKRPIRLGTGEFSDSLALDHITEYSKKFIEYFKDKNILFELKTKSKNIENLLNTKPIENIIISWSLNPQIIIDTEELSTASLEERIKSAYLLQKAGYKLAFHFDPIIYVDNWEFLYKEVIYKLYKNLKPPFSWISLGTLRSHRKLKTIVEQRFPKSNIFYGELFISEDKKLRYPDFLRKDIYSKMLNYIREYDAQTPIYLCMEDLQIWQVMDKKILSSSELERYLLRI